jgi:hypothetical protein
MINQTLIVKIKFFNKMKNICHGQALLHIENRYTTTFILLRYDFIRISLVLKKHIHDDRILLDLST